MSIPLPTTKLYIPQPSPNLDPRARLIEQLNAGASWGVMMQLLFSTR